jgi:hypothetical protein
MADLNDCQMVVVRWGCMVQMKVSWGQPFDMGSWDRMEVKLDQYFDLKKEWAAPDIEIGMAVEVVDMV